MPEPDVTRRAPIVAPPLGRSDRSETGEGRFPWTVVGVLLMAFVLSFYMWKWLIDARPVGATLIVVPLILIFTAPVLLRVARSERQFDLAGLMLVGLAIRFAFAYYRMEHAEDAGIYHVW